MNSTIKPAPSLDALAADPAKVASLETGQVCVVLTQLAGLQASLAARLLNRQEDDASVPDRMLSLEQAAEVLQQTPEWIRRHAKRLPFVRRISRKRFLCSETGLNRWLANRKV
jgi:hypothetical protein